VGSWDAGGGEALKVLTLVNLGLVALTLKMYTEILKIRELARDARP
jgi:hypothetical protein